MGNLHERPTPHRWWALSSYTLSVILPLAPFGTVGTRVAPGGVVVGKGERVNVRLSSEVYRPWAQLAEILDISVPELVRHYMTAAVPDVKGLIVMADKVNAGDREGAINVWTTMRNMHRVIDEHAPLDFAKGFTKKSADSNSDTVR